MPEPRPNESRNDFISRCVTDEEAVEDFPDRDQRLAFCFSEFERVRGSQHPDRRDEEEEEMNKEEQNASMMVGFFLSKRLANKLVIENGEKADTLHLTLSFHGKMKELPEDVRERAVNALKRISKQLAPLEGVIGGIGRFNASETSDGKDVLYMSFDSPALPEFRQAVVQELEKEGIPVKRNHGYSPHITLAFIDKDADLPIQRSKTHTIKFDAITLAIGDDKINIPLEGGSMIVENQTTIQKAWDNYCQKMIHYMSMIGESLNIQKKLNDHEIVEKEIQRFLDLPLANRDREWDGDAAENRVRRSAGGPNKEDINFNQYFRAFFWRDEDDPENLTSYKLGYADVIDGTLTAIPRGVFAVAAVLQGARGGVDIPEATQNEIKDVVSRWYAKMRREFDDETIIPPWEQETQLEGKSVKKEYTCDILKADEEKQLVSGVVLEPDTVDLQGDIISAEEIEKTAHGFLSKSRTMGFRHKQAAEAEVVESYIAPKDMVVAGQPVKKGSWIITAKVHDELLWKAIKDGTINSFSVGGSATRIQESSIA